MPTSLQSKFNLPLSIFSAHMTLLYSPNAPPISAPLVGMLTLTIPQSEPLGLQQ